MGMFIGAMNITLSHTGVNYSYYRLIVNLPFSRLPKARHLQRKCNAQEDVIMKQKREIKILQDKVKNAEFENATSPEKEAVEILMSMGTTPQQERIDTILPLVETVKQVRKAPMGVKKNLFPKKQTTLKERKLRRRSKIVKKISDAIKISREYIYRHRVARCKRASASAAKREKVNDFLTREDNSVQLPGRKDNIQGIQRYGLTDTMSNLYGKFVKEFPNIVVSKAFFFRSRRPSVKLIAHTQRRMCVCIKHANISLILKSAKVLPKSTQALVDMSIAEVKETLETIPSKKVAYRQWVKSSITFKGRIIKKDRLIDCKDKKKTFITKVINMLPGFYEHVERVGQQYKAVQMVKSVLKPDVECTVQMDFSENWTSKFQDEPSSVYYDKYQTTLHPMVVHYVDNMGNIKTISYVGVSNETNHSAPTIYSFITALINDLRGFMPALKRIHFISDSPSSQYRNKSIVSLIAQFPRIFSVTATWTWLEAGHGKGPCDGIGGAMKTQADNMVKAGLIIRNAMEFATCMKASATNIHILYVDGSDISQAKDTMEKWNIKPLPGLMKKHAIVPHDGYLYTKEASCFAECCYTDGKFIMGCAGWEKSQIAIETDFEEEFTTDVIEHGHVIPPSHENENDTEQGKACDSMEINDDFNDDDDIPLDQLLPHLQKKPSAIRKDNDKDSPKINAGTALQKIRRSERYQEGDFIAIPYAETWYIAQVTQLKKRLMEVSYMRRWGQVWKWGRQRDIGLIDPSTVITRLEQPHKVGNMFDIKDDEKSLITAFMAQQ